MNKLLKLILVATFSSASLSASAEYTPVTYSFTGIINQYSVPNGPYSVTPDYSSPYIGSSLTGSITFAPTLATYSPPCSACNQSTQGFNNSSTSSPSVFTESIDWAGGVSTSSVSNPTVISQSVQISPTQFSFDSLAAVDNWPDMQTRTWLQWKQLSLNVYPPYGNADMTILPNGDYTEAPTLFFNGIALGRGTFNSFVWSNGSASGETPLGYNVSFFITSMSANVTPVPEPETYGMMLMGIGMIGFIARRQKKQYQFTKQSITTF